MELKDEIKKLREKGLGYKKIAVCLNVSANIVKSICRREGLERLDIEDFDTCKVCADLKTIYNAPTEEQAKNNLDIIADKWEGKYPKLMSSWYSEWDAITPIFKFSVKVRTVIYTTNAVESVNSRLRSMNKKRSVFPNKVSLEKALYLAVERIVKKWTGAIRDWGQIYGELRIMYEDRI